VGGPVGGEWGQGKTTGKAREKEKGKRMKLYLRLK